MDALSRLANIVIVECKAASMFFKRTKSSEPKTSEPVSEPTVAESKTPEAAELMVSEGIAIDSEVEKESVSLFQRFKRGLSRTSTQLADGIGSLVLGKKEIDDELLEDIEAQLLSADVGFDATTKIIDELTLSVKRKELTDGDALYAALQKQLRELLAPVEKPLVATAENQPFVILVVGVNGVGKTTTIGKLAKRFQNEGKQVMLAAGDTFRAAAVEQLEVWGERNQVQVVAQHTGADSASVIYDAVASAQAKKIDVLIADTAGRLHNKNHLMDELAKVKRVMAKLDAAAPHEVLLVLDAGTGQNALNQTQQFIDAAGVTGIALTKLDGTAKGGVIFALSERFGLPVRFIGVGEGIDDLQPFSASTFVDALFNVNSEK
ncbi:MAG: fused signal recognition particle receptor [Cellvibrionaceae bacterium]|jgi:fused signal recognition particle receptor